MNGMPHLYGEYAAKLSIALALLNRVALKSAKDKVKARPDALRNGVVFLGQRGGEWGTTSHQSLAVTCDHAKSADEMSAEFYGNFNRCPMGG